MIRSLVAAATLFALPGAALAGSVLYPHAQALTDGIVARDPDILDVILHVSPTPDATNIVIAAHLTDAIGEASGDDDLGVMRTGAPLIEVQKDGKRLGILIQLRDAHHQPIGAIGLIYPYKPGDDIEAAVRRSFAIRDRLSRAIPSRAALAR